MPYFSSLRRFIFFVSLKLPYISPELNKINFFIFFILQKFNKFIVPRDGISKVSIGFVKYSFGEVIDAV